MKSIIVALTFIVLSFSLLAQKQVNIYLPQGQPAPVVFGVEKLKQAFVAKGYNVNQTNNHQKQSKGMVIATGLPLDNPVLESYMSSIFKEPESVLLKKTGKKNEMIIATGSDATGVMYALLDLAAQIEAMSANVDVFSQVNEVSENPFCTERSLSTYVRSEHVRTGYFHDPKYWDALFEQLAASRINSYDLIFKYRAPVYTLFFDVEGQPSNTTGGIVVSAEEQQRNLAALNSIVKNAHDHGIKITLGIWDHVSNPDDADRLALYTEKAIAKIINLVPFDAFQFRMHWESGLPREMDVLCKFWGSVYDGINNSGRKLRIYPRAKGLPDTIINIGVAKGMDFAIETKFSAEQMGMPFHPAHIQKPNQTDRRHSYADLLSYPKNYDMLYRVWNWGSQKLLVWGDTDWASRFARSTTLYNRSGLFEFMEIEGAKPMGNGTQRALTEKYNYADFEFQRYWYHNFTIGRMGYNPETPHEVFLREFSIRFGNEAAPFIMEALTQSSRIIPRIVSSAMPDFQEQRGVPEWGSGSGMNGQATLEAYSKILPLDIQTFVSFSEAAEMRINGEFSARVHPLQNADWYTTTANNIDRNIALAEKHIGSNRNKEYNATLKDMQIVAGMARFHAERIKAAIAYQMYLKLDNSSAALDTAIYYEKRAIQQYRNVVSVVGDMYRTDLNFTVSDAGHWKDELVLLEKAFEQLKNAEVKSKTIPPSVDFRDATDRMAPKVVHTPVLHAEPGKQMVIKASISDQSGVKLARVLYRGLTQFQDYQIVEMVASGNNFTAVIPAGKVDEVIEYNSETGALWDFMYLIEVIDNNGNGAIYPDYETTDPYVFVKMPHKTFGQTGGKKAKSRIADVTYTTNNDLGVFRILSPSNGDVFDSGKDIVVKVHTQKTDPNEKVEIYIAGKKADAEQVRKNEFVIKNLPNGVYRINAHITSKGLVTWSNTVEIVIGTSR